MSTLNGNFTSNTVGTIDSGHGLFALKRFAPDDVVVDYANTSESWQRVSFDDVPPAHKSLCWWIGESMEIAILAPPESLFMRANHSRLPNTLWNVKMKRLVANRAIEVGEEITYDYRLEIAPPSVKQHPPAWKKDHQARQERTKKTLRGQVDITL